jgi:hypothetical protein
MTSVANAKGSTGPRTALGKARAALNARRHGLNQPAIADPVLLEQVEQLTRALADETTDIEICQLARCVAEAQIEVQRVRYACHQHLVRTMSIPNYDSAANQRKKDQMVIRCLRTTGPFAPMPDDVVEFVYSWPEGPEKFATILTAEVHQLLLLDRYERRALSRRKFAIRALDEAKRQHRHRVLFRSTNGLSPSSSA